MKIGSHYLQIIASDVDAQNVWINSHHLNVNLGLWLQMLMPKMFGSTASPYINPGFVGGS